MEKERTEEKSQVMEILEMQSFANEKAQKRNHVIIIILIAGLLLSLVGNIGQGAYHIYKWSQFDTIVVESGENGAPANYIEGDNNKGVVYGTGYGTEEEK